MKRIDNAKVCNSLVRCVVPNGDYYVGPLWRDDKGNFILYRDEPVDILEDDADTIENFSKCLKEDFKKNGFWKCPLTDQQIEICFRRGVSSHQTYMIGCDVNAGYSFSESLAANA